MIILHVDLDGKSLHKCPINTGVPQGFHLCTNIFQLYINDLPDDNIYNTAIYADDTGLYFKCDLVSDLLELLGQ